MSVMLECEPARSVFVAVPAYDFRVDIDTINSIFAACGLFSSLGMNFTVSYAAGNCYVDMARNFLVRQFLESDCTDLLFVDSDVACDAKVPARLMMSRHPVCAALYPKKSEQEEWPVEFAIPEMGMAVPQDQSTDSEGFLRALLLPTGMMRINRQVFIDMLRLAPIKTYREHDGSETIEFFHLATDGPRRFRWGEDLLFCKTWREIGGECHFLADADMAHMGRRKWTGNWLKSKIKAGMVK